jgi:hypothetical protein
MCQGIVISLVKFKSKNKNVRVVLSGIGRHSDLIKSNLGKLQKAGWVGNISNESVISIESDFSAWNKFTVESEDQPNRAELKILKDTYKKCAGNARALIAHVKRCGKIDDALVNLLTASALAEYEKVEAPALAEYKKVTASALAKYNKVEAPALAEYKKVTAPALAEFDKVTASALAEYKKVTAPAWIKLFSLKSNRAPHLQ